MATLVSTTVITGGGGDYTSLSAWEAGEQTDLVTADEEHEVECSGGADSGGLCTISGWTTDATHPITVQGADGHKATSAWDTGIYRSEAVRVSQEYTTVQDLQLDGSGQGNAACRLDASNTTAQRCFCKDTAIPLQIVGGDDLVVRNCIAWATGSSGSDTIVLFNNGSTDLVAENLTGYRDQAGGGSVFSTGGTGSDPVVKNCLAAAAVSVTNFEGAYSAGSTNNFSEDATAPGSNPQTNGSVTFEDAANGDFTVTAGDSIDEGVDLSADFDDDINRDTRSAPWDIGAAEKTTTDFVLNGGIASAVASVIAATGLALSGGVPSAAASVLGSVGLTISAGGQAVAGAVVLSGGLGLSSNVPSAAASVIPSISFILGKWAAQVEQDDEWTDQSEQEDIWTDVAERTDSWTDA